MQVHGLRRTVSAAAAGLLALLQGCDAPTAPAPDACRRLEVLDLPLRTDSWGYTVTLGLNGHDVPLYFDTGAFTSTIEQDAATAAGLRPVPGHVNVAGVDGTIPLSVAVADNVRLGNAQLRDAMFTVMPHYGQNVKRQGRSGRGILGMDFLFAYDLDLNLAFRQARLYEQPAGCTNLVTTLSGEVHEVDLLPNDDDAPHVAITITIGNAELRAVIDTGATMSGLTHRGLRRVGRDKLVQLKSVTTFGLNSEIPVDVFVAPQLSIGPDVAMRNVRLNVIPDLPDGKIEMLLGRDFLERAHLWIARRAGKVLIQIPPTPSAPIALAPAGAGAG